MKVLALLVFLFALVVAGEAFMPKSANARNSKEIRTAKVDCSVIVIKPPTAICNSLKAVQSDEPCFSCSASTPAGYIQLLGTVTKAIYKGIKTAALAGVKLAVTTTSAFLSDIWLVGRLFYST